MNNHAMRMKNFIFSIEFVHFIIFVFILFILSFSIFFITKRVATNKYKKEILVLKENINILSISNDYLENELLKLEERSITLQDVLNTYKTLNIETSKSGSVHIKKVERIKTNESYKQNEIIEELRE